MPLTITTYSGRERGCNRGFVCVRLYAVMVMEESRSSSIV